MTARPPNKGGGGLPDLPPLGHMAVFRAADRHYVAIIVEGPSDVAVWSHWLRYRPIPVNGRIQVLRWIRELTEAGEVGFLGILDANCVRLEGTDDRAKNVIVSENHDLETDLMRSETLSKFLSAVDALAVGALGGTAAVRKRLLDSGHLFGLIRWHFFRVRHEYDAGRLSPHRFVNVDSLALDSAALIAEAASLLGRSAPDLQTEISQLEARGADPWHVCNGHDLVEILAGACRGALRAKKRMPHSDAVFAALCLSVDSTYLESLRMWRDLRDWQAMNAPFVIFR